ncbi:MAG: methyltransferase domain-containing protein [Saprospiraceae bacterium]|nr:methyltransferase domain-containing protein [Saprospiraceae bacterium]
MNKIALKITRLSKKIGKKLKGKENLYFCPVCNSNTRFNHFPYQSYFSEFYKHGFVHSPFLFETLNLNQYKCVLCRSSDRERLISMFINRYISENPDKELNLVEFAPKKPLQKFLKNKVNINYRCADLSMKDVDDNVNITNMNSYSDNLFDMFICSHILEHIEDDEKAMQELFRITKKNGTGLLLVPIMLSLSSTLENKDYLKTEHLRWKYFGQHDHVRMYSRDDFIHRLERVGFKVKQLGQNYFGKEEFKKNGIDQRSILYVVEK